jgi:hypothetical protein
MALLIETANGSLAVVRLLLAARPLPDAALDASTDGAAAIAAKAREKRALTTR